ncbi:MAG: universal stress protein [Pseudomonadota bacterium]
MTNTTALFLMDRETTDETITDFAEAARPTNTHVSCLVLGLAPQVPLGGFGIPPYGAMDVPDDWFEILKMERKRENTRVQEIEQMLARTNTSGDVQSAFTVQNEIKHHVARRARVCDLAYAAPNLRESPVFREAAAGVLFDSPIGLVVNCPLPAEPQAVFIAWDSSNAAARAVHAALPIIKEAKDVFVGCFDPKTTPTADGINPGSGLASWLSHYGCKVTVNQYPSGGQELGQCIQDRAREIGADLVVMGAYGHSRMIQAVFGGTSRSMMEQTELPVFFAH